MKKIFLLFLLLATGILAFTQNNFLPGTITKKSGKLIIGYIDYREWTINPSKIRFKTDLQLVDSSYTVFDLSSFEITGKERFVVASIKKDMRPVKLQGLTVIPPVIVQDDIVFLRELFWSEKIALYLFRDFKDHFYVKESDGKFTELIYRVELVGGNAMDEKNIFRNQLLVYFPEAKNNEIVNDKLEKLKYKENDLSSFFYLVTNTTPKPKIKNKPIFFAGTGVMLSKLKISGNTKLADHNFDFSASPLFFAGVDLVSKRNRGAFVVRAQLEYYYLNYKTTYDRPIRPTIIQNETYTLQIGNLKPSMAILYNFWNQPASKIYGGIELLANISNYKKNTFNWKDEANGHDITEENILVYQNAWFSVNAVSGIIIAKHFDLSVSSRLLGSFSNTTGVNVNPTLLAMRVSYRF